MSGRRAFALGVVCLVGAVAGCGGSQTGGTPKLGAAAALARPYLQALSHTSTAQSPRPRRASPPSAASHAVSSRSAPAHLTQALARLFLVHTTHYAGGMPRDPGTAIALLENGRAKSRGSSPRRTQHVGNGKEGVAGLLAALPVLSKPAGRK
jgi:hypothetical protein